MEVCPHDFTAVEDKEMTAAITVPSYLPEIRMRDAFTAKSKAFFSFENCGKPWKFRTLKKESGLQLIFINDGQSSKITYFYQRYVFE